MTKKKLSLIFIILMFIISTIFFVPHKKCYTVTEVKSPVNFTIDNKDFILTDLDTFDSSFSAKNKTISKTLNISEEEAFILGNLGKYWATNLMKGRNIFINNTDLKYNHYSYRTKFLYSGFCLIDSKPCSIKAFERKLKEIRRGNYKIIDFETNKIYNIEDKTARNLKNFIIIKKSHLPKFAMLNQSPSLEYKDNDIKIYFTDSTTNLKPNRECSTALCQEILNNINSAKTSIDIAIYGFSKIPAIEEAFSNAIKRGVVIRLVCDADSNGNNIYPDTQALMDIVKNYRTDFSSPESRNLMHNKFIIFDNKTLITGSANLSYTDMSGFNTNSVIIINSEDIANIYKKEFEQMYQNKFHNTKQSQNNKRITINNKDFEIFFSPQDKSITQAIIPLIHNAQKYIYIPTFVLTEKRVTEELINAKRRGVEIKIIIDALNASIRHSKHKELRFGGLKVKTENYAGKMHSKSMIIDDKFTIIGSMNFSNSGENKNDENLIIIKNSEIAKFYKDFFLYQWNKIDDQWLDQNVRAESKDSIGSCMDGLDNNYDGLVDEFDPACK